MIESRYWKEDLLSHAKRLRPVKKPPRWSERLVVNFEKELIVSLFLIRKLLDEHKVSSKSKDYKATVFCCDTTGTKITRLNQYAIDEIYDLSQEREVKKDIRFLANQLIHGGTLFGYREPDRNWGGVYAVSDHERNNTIYRIPVSELIQILELVGNDYPASVELVWDVSQGDYTVRTE